jgi:DNA helicase-2/ATP-dependent DNA helicase PcrA
VSDVIEVSYTGDLLAHRRCPRAWAYEKHAGFHPYEQVQAMEGRLVHHAMEWLTKFRKDTGRHADRAELKAQLEHYFRVLWARGVRTAFASKEKTIKRVLDNLFPPPKGEDEGRDMHPTVLAAIEGAQHTEYELQTVRKLVPIEHDGKKRLLLTGILDLVIQQQQPLRYKRVWKWTDRKKLIGEPAKGDVQARINDLEIWDYKGTRGYSEYLNDYALQLLTYANLYRERTGRRPERCILFFINEPKRDEQLLAIPLEDDLLEAALAWTVARVKELQQTIRDFRSDPCSVLGGDKTDDKGRRSVSEILKAQCTACGERFECPTYVGGLKGGTSHPDVQKLNVFKN